MTIVYTSDGAHSNTAYDTALPHLKNILGLMGMNDVVAIIAEGLAFENKGNDRFTNAEREIELLFGSDMRMS